MGMELNALTDRGTSDSLTRRFGLPSSSNITLAPELMPVASIGELPELLFHQGWRRWQRGFNTAAAAGQAARAMFRVLDPPSSVIVVLERIMVSSGTATEILADWGYGPGAADLGAPLTAFEPRDFRQTPAAGDQVVLSTTTSAALLATTAVDFTIPANTPFDVPGGPWVCFPGSNLLLGNTSLNSQMFWNFVWRTRRLQEQENVP